MPANITIVHGREFLNPQTHGEIDVKRIKALIDRVADAVSRSSECDVLYDGRDSHGHFDNTQLKDLASYFAARGEFVGRKVAIIKRLTAEEKEQDDFFVKLVRERGFLVKSFEDYEAAISWLMPSSELA